VEPASAESHGLPFPETASGRPLLPRLRLSQHGVGVECDGDYHDRHGNDRTRDRFLEKQGFVVMRFWNSEVLFDTTNVINTIARHGHPSFDRAVWSVERRRTQLRTGYPRAERRWLMADSTADVEDL